MTKTASEPAGPCTLCGGTGHYRTHHPAMENRGASADKGKGGKGGEKDSSGGKGKDKGGDRKPTGGGGGDSDPAKTPCRFWTKFGKCREGDKCRYKHDPKDRGRQQRKTQTADTPEPAPAAPGADQAKEAADAALMVNTGRTRDADGKIIRMLRINRAQVAEPTEPLVDFDRLKLPIVAKPPPGYHHGSDVTPAKLDETIHVIWDGGAEGTSLSARAASRTLRLQAQLPVEQRIAFTDLGRYQIPQNFYGYTGDIAPEKIDVQGY